MSVMMRSREVGSGGRVWRMRTGKAAAETVSPGFDGFIRGVATDGLDPDGFVVFEGEPELQREGAVVQPS